MFHPSFEPTAKPIMFKSKFYKKAQAEKYKVKAGATLQWKS